ncbi:hypothetical protein GCM10009639_61250 [Kitasatospora putterlickiae]|uniref:DUF397 domain-containing protein n=1 Tax=Kitasatospora putterlickiae TaxID=221725 RepID=A0ABN1YFL7_9ACTN
MAGRTWQKSSYSGASNGCVEVRALDDLIEVRESDEPGTTLGVSPAVFADLLSSIKVGGLDHGS